MEYSTLVVALAQPKVFNMAFIHASRSASKEGHRILFASMYLMIFT